MANLPEQGEFLPLARRSIDYDSLIFPARYALVRDSDGSELALFRQHFNPAVYRLGIAPKVEDEHLGELLMLAAGCVIAAIEGRQS